MRDTRVAPSERATRSHGLTMHNGTATRAISVEARTIRKVRIRILPFIFLLYIVAFVDRINIGFAGLTMNKELAITPQQFGLLTGIFFIGYFLDRCPAALPPKLSAALQRVDTHLDALINNAVPSTKAA